MSLSSADSESLRLAVYAAISSVLEIPPSEIFPESDFLSDFGASSLDIVNLIWHIEEKFSLPEASETELEGLCCVQDLVDLVLKKAPGSVLDNKDRPKNMRFAIASDHAGIQLKSLILNQLKDMQFEVEDLGPQEGTSVDYPNFAEKVAKQIQASSVDLGILICGTGIGMSIAANKFAGVRAALCSDPVSAKFTRLHNDANILCLGARIIGQEIAMECVRQFVDTNFDEGDDSRHQRRLDLVSALESPKK